MKALFLKFDSEYNCRMVTKNISAGRVHFEDGIWVVDQAKPFLLKTTFGVKPLYIIKWDKPYPAVGFKDREKGKVEKEKNDRVDDVAERLEEFELQRGEARRVDSKKIGDVFPEYKYYRPEMLKALADMEVMKNLLGPKKKSIAPIIMLILGMFIGVIVVYLLRNFGLLHF